MNAKGGKDKETAARLLAGRFATSSSIQNSVLAGLFRPRRVALFVFYAFAVAER